MEHTVEDVRKRPGMLVGGTDGTGVLNLILEPLTIALEQHAAGQCSRASIGIVGDGTVTFETDGPGLDGLGLLVVRALSDRFVQTETRIEFRPDSLIFKHPRAPRTELTRRLEDLTFLYPRFALRWSIDGDDAAAGGLPTRVALGVGCDLEDVATHRGTYGSIDVEVALAWHAKSSWHWGDPTIHSFVNMARTCDHGSHVDGLLEGIRAFFAGDEDRTRGLFAVVSVVLEDPRWFESKKDRLVSAEVAEPVAQATKTALEAWTRRRATSSR